MNAVEAGAECQPPRVLRLGGAFWLNRNVLRAFLHHSREWSRATRGLELFEMSAHDLQQFADVDTGFFVYRKRVLMNGITPQKAMVWVPWGAFANDTVQLQSLVDEVLPDVGMLASMMERWVLAEDMPGPLRERWGHYGLLEIGIWPLISREQPMGAIVVGKTQRNSDGLTLDTRLALLDACAAQTSLALDLILAMRVAEEASKRDLLTGVLNRRGLESKFPELLETISAPDECLLFGVIDLDNLKTLNDTSGHPAGDTALRQVGENIRRNLNTGDLVGRLGGDEFAVAIKVRLSDLEAKKAQIRNAITQDANGFSASVGWAVWGEDGHTLDECYRKADERLYDCKRQKKMDLTIS